MMTSIFTYSPLPEDHIRVLRPHGTDWSNRLQCSLTEIPLDKTTEYDALFYAWNNEFPTRPISCNGGSMLITASLDGALRTLQDRGWSRPPWADAICINQTDQKDKERQVPRMGQIYLHAHTVIAWLGPSSPYTDLAMESIDLLIERFAAVDCLNPITSVRNLSAYGLPHREDFVWSGLRDLVSRKYFRRLWTVQEVTLAKCCLIFCGHKFISWHQLASLAECPEFSAVGHYLSKRNIVNMRGKKPNGTYGTALNYARRVAKVQRLRHHGDVVPLLFLLDISQVMEASEPVDRVYAGLALADRTLLNDIEFDYSNENRRLYWRLYTHVGHILLREMNSLEVFNHVSAQEEGSQLPTWCPDWNSDREAWTFSRGNYKAGGTFPRTTASAHIATSLDKTNLLLRGMHVEEVIEVGHLAYPRAHAYALDPASRAARAAVILKWLDEGFKIAHQTYPTKFEPLLRVLCTNWLSQPWAYRPDLSTLQKSIHVLRTFLENTSDRTITSLTDEERRNVARYFDALAYSCTGRRVVSTRRGRLGLGHRRVTQGDEIYVFEGEATPFILRPQPEQDCFRLVGEVYVHGIMDGELFAQEQPEGSFVERIVTIA